MKTSYESQTGIGKACCGNCADGKPCGGVAGVLYNNLDDRLPPHAGMHQEIYGGNIPHNPGAPQTLGGDDFGGRVSLGAPHLTWSRYLQTHHRLPTPIWGVRPRGHEQDSAPAFGLGQDLVIRHRNALYDDNRAPYFGFGDAAAFAQAESDLVSQMGSTIARGSAALVAGDVATALQAFKDAGQWGASTLGPEIDAAGAPNVTQPITQAAWDLNKTLQSYSQTQVRDAQSAANQMFGSYQNAIAAGIQALGGAPGPKPSPGPVPVPPPVPPTPPAQKDYTTPILVGSGVVAAGILGWAFFGKKGRRR